MASRRVKKSKGGEKKNSLSQKQKPQQSKVENYVETLESNGTPYVRIIEQPASRMVRFRYECEGRTAAAVPGVSSTPRDRTYPEIEIVGYRGASVVVVSCVSKDAPYRPHPYNLIGKEGCRRGVYTVANKSGITRIKFFSLGIQCVKRTGVEASLKIRENIRVDPFKTGFEHATEAVFVDMTAVRLCFQVFIEDSSGRYTIPLKPVVSEPIYDSRAVADLKIYQMCSSSTVLADKPIILLCDKINREKTMVRFYEEKDNDIIWQSYGDYRPSDIHRQTAIKLYPPQYPNLDITEPVQVYVQLVSIDGFASEPYPFKYLPIDSDEVLLKRKCKRIGLEIDTDSKKGHHASSGDSFRNIMESWLKSNISRSPSTHLKEDLYTETSSSDESSESTDNSIPEVISDVISVRMESSEDSNDTVASHKFHIAAHQLPINSTPNYQQQQQASPNKSDYQHEYFQTESPGMKQPQSASSPLSIGQKSSFIETPQPESLQLQQHRLKLTPHHENTPPRLHKLQQQHLSMKSAHPLQMNSAQLQSPDHLPIESHEHELRQKQNLSMSSPHQMKHSPQPLPLRLDSPQLQLSGQSSMESQEFKRQGNFSILSPQQPSPNEIPELQKQLPLGLDTSQLQPPMGSHQLKQQQNFTVPSAQQPLKENQELRKQSQAMVLPQPQYFHPKSPQMQQHLSQQSPQHGNFPAESAKLQQQRLSMKSSHSLPPRMDSAQLQQEYLSIESHEHELKQKQNLSMSSPHPLEQSPQPLSLRLDSPQLHVSEHPAMESHEPKQQRNFPMRSPHQRPPNELQELLQQLPLRFDSPQLQLPEQPAMESHGFEQQRNFSIASPLQPPIKTDELNQQNQLMPSAQQLQQQQTFQWPQQLVKHSPLHHNSPIKSHDLEQQQHSVQSHLQSESPQSQQQYAQGQSPHYQQQYYPKPTAHPMESIELKQQSQTIQSSQQQQSLYMNTFQVKQNVSGRAQQQYLPMNSPQQQQQNVLLPNSNLQPLGIAPQQQSLQLQQLQSLMLMSTQLQQLQQQQPHSTQQLLQPNHNTIAPLQDTGMLATVLANAFATLLDNYQSKFQQLIAATANTMLQTGQWNIPPTNNTVNTLVQTQQQQQQQQQFMAQQQQQSPAHQQQQEITQHLEQQQPQQSPAHLQQQEIIQHLEQQQPQQSPAHLQQQEIIQHLEQQQPHQDLARAQIQQRSTNNTHLEGTPNHEQSNDHALHNLLNLEENTDNNSIPSSALWSFDT